MANIGELIYTGVKSIDFTPQQQQNSSRSRGSPPQVVSWGRPLWQVAISFQNLNDTKYGNIKAQLALCDGGANTILVCDRRRVAPRQAPSMSNSGVGLGTVDASASTVVFTGVSTNKFSAGDMIGYRTATNGYYLGMVTADANPSSGSVTLSVYPPPRTPHASVPAPKVNAATGEFQLQGAPQLSGSFDRSKGGVSFTLLEV